MTPAEMREMAAKVAEQYLGGVYTTRLIAAAIRALPIPDTTAADDAELPPCRHMDCMNYMRCCHSGECVAGSISQTHDVRGLTRELDNLADIKATLETAREALIAKMAVQDDEADMAANVLARSALAAIDAAKAKGGG